MIRCCVCRSPATQICWDAGYHHPSCLTCWPKVIIPKDPQNHPVSGELVFL